MIVTYNSAPVLGGCLASLPEGAKGVRLTDVVVADNASKDDSLGIAEQAAGLPVRPLQVGRNAGYAAAINAGVASLDLDGLDAVLVLNPDCRLRPGALAVLAAVLDRPGTGIAVPGWSAPRGCCTTRCAARPPSAARWPSRWSAAGWRAGSARWAR
ncbi:glycosyltransferase family 2 protein [Actinomadura sp. ATCC 39365]